MKNIFILAISAGLLLSCSNNEEIKIEESSAVEEVKNGLTLEQRKEIFREISKMEKNAQLEADKKFDVVNDVTDESIKQNVAENTRLKEEGQALIMEKFKIKDKIYWDIAAEGAMGGW
jgi:hypothetical protein